MVTIETVRHIHFELSSMCNARCPFCPRNFYGFPHDTGFVETNLSLDQIQQLLSSDFISQLDEVLINGNFGDFVMNPESVEIISWLRQCNDRMKIHISTNGGARNKEFWEQLAKLNLEISFCIDGLDDTHHIYRQDTTYKQVIKNASYYINAGGEASWVMTEFDHNRHQLEQAKLESQRLGFIQFTSRPTSRNAGPAYNRQGQKVFKFKNIDNAYPDTITESWVKDFRKKTILKTEPLSHIAKVNTNLSCESNNLKSIYISSEGKITPCCYLALYSWHPRFNHGVEELLTTQSLHDSVRLFDKIEETFTNKQLNACQLNCQG